LIETVGPLLLLLLLLFVEFSASSNSSSGMASLLGLGTVVLVRLDVW
jgi:hypothetical protein